MSTSRNAFAVVGLTTVLTFSVATTTCAQQNQIFSGDVPVVADISYQQYVNNVLVTSINETNVPSTLSFTAGFVGFQGVLMLDLESNVPVPFELNTNLAMIFWTDGIPGISADNLTATVDYNTEYGGYAGTLNLVDPTGEFIGPNGDGSISGVRVTGGFSEFSASPEGTSSNNGAIEFQTVVPEPSSIVLLVSGLVLIAAVAFTRACQVRRLQIQLPWANRKRGAARRMLHVN